VRVSFLCFHSRLLFAHQICFIQLMFAVVFVVALKF
jgi:hypothetical protein